MRSFVIALLVLGPTLASADSIEEKRGRSNAERRVKEGIKMMNKKCNTSIPETGVIDWSSWKSTPGEDVWKVGSRCHYISSGVWDLCNEDEIAQQTVAKSVKKIVCKGDSTEGPRFELKKGALVVHMSFEDKNMNYKTKEWLSKNLE
jgi:hypothetical protein